MAKVAKRERNSGLQVENVVTQGRGEEAVLLLNKVKYRNKVIKMELEGNKQF